MTKRRGLTIAAAALTLGIGAVVFVGAGAYNVAATTPHARLTHWLMHTTMERSVAARADEIPAPPTLDSTMVSRGFAEYNEMCVACHGAPGVKPGVLGVGMNPKPPDLVKEASEWNDRELFWIVKHGLKMTGMPAFGATHSERDLWSIVAVVRRLQYMSAEEYQRTVADAGAHGGMHAAVAESGGEVQPRDAQAHAHAGAQAATSGRSGGAQRTAHAGPGMDHSRMDGARNRRDPVQPTPHEQHQPAIIDQAAPSHTPAQGDVESVKKLKALAAELLRDSIVMDRIRADSALRRRWRSATVRKELARPPQ